MTDLRKAAEMACEVPLHELLEGVPENARLVIDSEDGMNTNYIPVGQYCRRAASALRQALAQEHEPWTPVEIGVDITEEGTHVVGMYVLMPDVLRYVFYSKFHSAPKREWVGLTDDEIGWLWHNSPPNSHEYARAIEAKLKEKNGG